MLNPWPAGTDEGGCAVTASMFSPAGVIVKPLVAPETACVLTVAVAVMVGVPDLVSA